MELKDTIDLMNSSDYNDRFRAEYYQAEIRRNKLNDMCIKYEAGTLDFKPTCALSILTQQRRYMDEYIRILRVRAEIEGIDLG